MSRATKRRAKPDLATAQGYADQAREAMDQVWGCLYGAESDLEDDARDLHRRLEGFCRELHTERVERESDGELIGERHG